FFLEWFFNSAKLILRQKNMRVKYAVRSALLLAVHVVMPQEAIYEEVHAYIYHAANRRRRM
ncbi:MAG: hypothetical protein CRN43_10550, partial [Candidatus Nephrothrix sp. EaCA]